MSESEFILSGVKSTVNLPDQSISTIIFQKLQNRELKSLEIIEARSGTAVKQDEIFEEITQLAASLQRIVQKGDLVAVISENSYKYVITTIALLLLGVKVEHLNPDYTINELRQFFKIATPKLVFTSLKALTSIEKLKNDIYFLIICLDNTENNTKIDSSCLIKNGIGNFEPVDVEMEETSMIFSSSGTTGLPKAVENTHSNFRSQMDSWGDPHLIGINSNDSILLYLPFFHIFGQLVVLAAFLYGCKMVIMDKFHPERFFELIATHRISKLFGVSPTVLFLAKTPLIDKYDVSSIEDILCGGAPLKKEVEEIVAKRLNGVSLRQMYGLTEASGIVTVTPKFNIRPGTIGKVAPNCCVKVCHTETGKTLGPNQIGELFLKGNGIMRRYLNNIEETRVVIDENGWLRTGDLAYYDDDGYFYIVDRVKEMIKYKGFQVAPAELENLLLNHPAVKDVGVVGAPHERAIEVPLAFVVKKPECDVTENELIQFVAENLSMQKHLHGGVRFIDNIPRNASGKILRRKLKEIL